VGKATGWKAGRCRHVQISELFSIEECDQAVMDFLAATESGSSRPNETKWRYGVGSGLRAHERAQSSGAEGAAIMGLYLSSFLSFFLSFYLSFVSGDEG
jgi:hypothetical protein